MKLQPKITIADHFSDLEDPRIERTKRHQLIDIITISICAVICGADTWVDIESYGRSKYEWLKKFLELPNGIPSHDTIARVFSRLKPEQFQKCFLSWVKSISCFNPGEVIAIDGKALRHSYARGGEQKAIHMVSAWATSQRLVLGQVKVDKKSNEITAIPTLLKVLELNGSIVTIDAMGCQRSIVKSIVEQGGDYVITLKNNQSSLYARVKELFEQAMRKKYSGFIYTAYSTKKESNHGRSEIRHHLMLSEIKELVDPDNKWEKLHSIGMKESVRIMKGKTTIETRYYISSLENNAQKFGESVRSHWGIENSLHWVLDVGFREDDCRSRKDKAPQNFAILRHISLNLLTTEKTSKTGVKNKRLRAWWDDDYLTKILAVSVS